MEIKAPILSKVKLKHKAEKFLAKYNPKRIFPLEIELIAEKEGIKIYPIPDLKKIAGTEGFINPDLTQAGIDDEIYFKTETRARFTIAHEVGHWFLHKDIYTEIKKKIKLNSFLDYSQFIDKIPPKEYDWIEWQAYFFAAQILVPSNELKVKTKQLLNDRLGKSVPEDVLFPIAEELDLFFNVSTQVIRKRFVEDKLAEILSVGFDSGYNRG